MPTEKCEFMEISRITLVKSLWPDNPFLCTVSKEERTSPEVKFVDELNAITEVLPRAYFPPD